MITTKLDKALFIANVRVAACHGAREVNSEGGFACDIPAYTGYGKDMSSLQRASEDLRVDFKYLDTTPPKIHVSRVMGNGASLGLTVPLTGTSDENMQLSIIALLHLYWLVFSDTTKHTGRIVDELAQLFDVSFGAGQSATAD